VLSKCFDKVVCYADHVVTLHATHVNIVQRCRGYLPAYLPGTSPLHARSTLINDVDNTSTSSSSLLQPRRPALTGGPRSLKFARIRTRYAMHTRRNHRAAIPLFVQRCRDRRRDDCRNSCNARTVCQRKKDLIFVSRQSRGNSDVHKWTQSKKEANFVSSTVVILTVIGRRRQDRCSCIQRLQRLQLAATIAACIRLVIIRIKHFTTQETTYSI